MRKKVNVMAGLVAAFIAGSVLGAVVELGLMRASPRWRMKKPGLQIR